MDLPSVVEVQAPSRLHFGMLSFGQSQMQQFGGAGAMVALPGVHVRLTRADGWEATGPHAERASELARRFGQAASLPQDFAARIQVLSAPRQHCGLGVGSQLALALGVGLAKLAGGPEIPRPQLAAWLGRGGRSSIGVHGFFQGGLLVEAGKPPGGGLAPLSARVDLPPQWRFVLICPRDAEGLSGQAEAEAFARLPPVPRETTARLCKELLLGLLPAARQANFELFSKSLYEFGRTAGTCFAACQNGPYASPSLERLVEAIRALGVAGVGQSSWGPTLYAALPDPSAADTLVAQLQSLPEMADSHFVITPPCNSGARITPL
jgi:beta-RFAP synthase